MATRGPSKKWVDYSDDESELEASPSPKRKASEQPDPPSPPPPLSLPDPPSQHLYLPSRDEIDDELDKLDELDDRGEDEVWLEMSAREQDYLEEEMDYLRGKARRQGNIVSVFRAREKEAYHVRVYIKVAYDYVENGYDKSDRMKTVVAERNFDRPRRAEDRSRRKKYVDKDPKDTPYKPKQLGSSQQGGGRRYYEKREQEQPSKAEGRDGPSVPEKGAKPRDKQKGEKREKKGKQGGKVSKTQNPFEMLDLE